MKRTLFVTGSDTGVGKTVLSMLLTRYLRECGVNVAALKPICSGGRGDALALRSALNQTLSLDEINPWHFRAPIAPALAARRERRRVLLADVLVHIRGMQKRFDVVLLEGAGGLLSPLGADFNSRDLLVTLRATPIVVCPNRLGAVNQAMLTLEALPKSLRREARIVLVSPQKPDAATATNARLLLELSDAKRIITLPRSGEKCSTAETLRTPRVRRSLRALIGKQTEELWRRRGFQGSLGSPLDFCADTLVTRKDCRNG